MRILWVDDNADLFPGHSRAFTKEAQEHEMDLKIATSYEEAIKIISEQAGLIKLMIFDFTLSRRGFHMISGRRRGLDIVNVAISNDIRLFIAFSVLGQREMQAAWKQNESATTADMANVRFMPFQKEASVDDVVAGLREFLGNAGGPARERV